MTKSFYAGFIKLKNFRTWEGLRSHLIYCIRFADEETEAQCCEVIFFFLLKASILGVISEF